MAWRPSAALRNYLLEGGSLKHALSNCVIKVYTGSQPATPEAAPTGTLLVTYTLAGGTPTREVRAVGSVALTSGSSGSIDTLTFGGFEVMGSATSYDTSLAVTAQAIVDKINDNPRNTLVDATLTSTSTVTLTAKRGMGALGNQTIASTATTLGKTDTNATGGVTAVNCLKWGNAAAGVLAKLSTETWSGTAVATGTAGWFRIEASVTDAGGLDSTESVIRADGAIATSGAELNMTPTSITSAAVQTLSTFTITLPSA